MDRIVQRVMFEAPKQERLKRVAAYSRVSNGKDTMLHSLSAQISYYSNLIQNHEGWIYCGVYSDEHAIIGTSGENLVKSRVSAFVPFNFFVKGKYNFI